MEIDTACSFEEAKDLLEDSENYYSMAIIDLHLFDLRGEELVDLVLDKKIPTIVMTDDTEKAKNVVNKDIVDYILKDRSESIDYMIETIDRVLKNRDITVLIAEESEINRKKIEKILKTQLLNVIMVDNGIEAIKSVRENRNIKLVLTAHDMPKANGVELVIALRKAFTKDELPIIGIANDNICTTKFLKYGVNDLIKMPYFKDELSVRVNNVLQAQENIEKLKHFADTDYLTQIPNRKYFYKEVKTFYKEAKEAKTPFALAMIDIDNFKQINDTYGHSVGDTVIKTLASEIKANIKGRDIVARFGGEEFCVVLKDIKDNSAYRFLESLRKKIEDLNIVIDSEKSISFTVSIGFTTEFGKNLDDMMRMSDEYLYKAKREGKNRVCHPEEKREEALV
jgi:diguanylate cyclase (GGDEF)-like protein